MIELNKEFRAEHRRLYTGEKNGLKVAIEIRTGKCKHLAKLLKYNLDDIYMFADVCLTDADGIRTIYKANNEDAILKILGLESVPGRFSVVKMFKFTEETDADNYAAQILAAV